jgi:hypothetical protein
VNALANAEVGEYLNRHCVATFQKVGTFRVADGQKQGGNVASYFCTPDGGILAALAGPVDAATLLREARWVVETRKMALLESRGDMTQYKRFFRRAHAEQLPPNGLVARVNWARLPLTAPTSEAMTTLLDQDPVARSLDKPGRVHLLLAAYPLVPLSQAYKVIYERIVGEQISTLPVAEGPQTRLPLAPARWGTPAMGGARPAPPSPEERRERARAAEVHYARNCSATTEICAAAPLNAMLDDLLKSRAAGDESGPAKPLAADVLAHLNVAAGTGNGANVGLLRDGGALRWPAAWREAPLSGPSRELRDAVQALVKEGLSQGHKGPVDGALLQELRDDVTGLDGLLAGKITAMEPTAYIEAKGYLKQLNSAVRLLERDDVTKYIAGAFTLDPAKIKTVTDLIAFMGDHGLKFTPAVAGDEAAYVALHRALADASRGEGSLLAVSSGAQ